MAYPQEFFRNVSLLPGSLLYDRRKAVAANTLLYQLEILKKTGRYDAFKLGWHPTYDEELAVWPVPKHLFWDSDIGKWIEGACYILQDERHPKIEAAITELCGMIQKAQQPDGYLNIHYTVVEPGKRFTNLRDMHELYNCGHLIEAALAHHALFQNEDLLRPMLKYVGLLCKVLGPGDDQIHGYPGHPEIELALLRLYRRTGDAKHLALAKYFIKERGNPTGADGRQYFEKEAKDRGELEGRERPGYWPSLNCQWYYQAHKPIVQQPTIEGHSVRATYLLTAATDLLRYEKDDTKLFTAIHRLWDNMVQKKMYLTGGIGSIKQYEGFGIDYFLPQGTDEGGCYAETCAAIGVMMLAERILKIELDGKVTDVMELSLYNAVLTAMSHDGTKFTYINQLASSDEDPAQRSEWFVCACCPPNIMRVLGQIGGYIYSVDAEEPSATVNVHLFVSSSTKFEVGGQSVTLSQKSDWPWSGDIDFELESSSQKVDINIRIPAWAEDWSIKPATAKDALQNGYLRLTADWLVTNPRFSLHIPLRPRIISPNPRTGQDIIAIARGPIVYCVEDNDNPWVEDHFKNVLLDPKSKVVEKEVTDSTTQDKYVALSVEHGAVIVEAKDDTFAPAGSTATLDSAQQSAKVIDTLHFVPYFFRSNRGGKGQSRVGLRRWIT